MTIPNNIRTALEADFSDLIQWSSILNYFSSHQSELSLPEKISIYEKSEGFRIFWSRLKIDKKDVYPNNVYTDEELLDYFQTKTQTSFQIIENNKPATESRRATDLIEQGSALAI